MSCLLSYHVCTISLLWLLWEFDESSSASNRIECLDAPSPAITRGQTRSVHGSDGPRAVLSVRCRLWSLRSRARVFAAWFLLYLKKDVHTRCVLSISASKSLLRTFWSRLRVVRLACEPYKKRSTAICRSHGGCLLFNSVLLSASVIASRRLDDKRKGGQATDCFVIDN